MDASDTSIVDEAGSLVKQRFYDFILESQSAEESENTTHQQRLMIDYKAQISSMIQNDKTTLFVSYLHLSDFDYELMEGFMLSLIVSFSCQLPLQTFLPLAFNSSIYQPLAFIKDSPQYYSNLFFL